MVSKKNLLLFVISLLLVFLAVRPLFKPGFFEIHDQTHFERLYEMDKCLKAGQFPCRITPDFAFGFGYPLFNFYAPLSYYLGEFFHLSGFGFIDSIKAVFVLSVMLGWLGMFFLSKEFFGFYGGLASALIYVYTPYRAINLYVRGALSESLALGLVPLVVYFFIKMIKQASECHPEPIRHELTASRMLVSGSYYSKEMPKLVFDREAQTESVQHDKKEKFKGKVLFLVSLSGLSYALLILSHNLTVMIFSGFLFVSLIIYFLYLKFNKKPSHTTYYMLLATIFGLCLSSFFWLPAIVEKPLVSTESMIKGILDYHLHFPKISQIIYSKWTYGGSGANVGISAQDMSFQLGILNWLVIPIALFLLVRLWQKKKEITPVLLFAICYLLLAIFLITSKSRFLWDLIPLMSYIQFPWRFLGWTTFFSSFLIGSLFLISKDKKINFLLLVTCYVLLITLNIKYFKPKSQFLIDEKSYLTTNLISSGTTGVTDEYLPKWVKEKPTKRANDLIEVKNGEVVIKNLTANFFKTEFDYSAKKESEVIINYIYYPVFKVFINNKEVSVDYSNNRGLITFNLKKVNGRAKVIFTETPLREITNYISLISLTIYLFFTIKFMSKV